jgi:hypothetical protein
MSQRRLPRPAKEACYRRPWDRRRDQSNSPSIALSRQQATNNNQSHPSTDNDDGSEESNASADDVDAVASDAAAIPPAVASPKPVAATDEDALEHGAVDFSTATASAAVKPDVADEEVDESVDFHAATDGEAIDPLNIGGGNDDDGVDQGNDGGNDVVPELIGNIDLVRDGDVDARDDDALSLSDDSSHDENGRRRVHEDSLLKHQRTSGIEGINDMNLVSNLELEEYGELFDKARQLRTQEWKLLSDPQSIKPPTRIVKEVTEFINSIMKDKQQLKAIPTLKDTKAACLKLRDDELEGEVRQGGESVPEVVKDRVLIGRDTPAHELVFCSQYSMCLKVKDSELKKL